MSRASHEHQIRSLDPKLAADFEGALSWLAYRHGLQWFTDEQLADIRDFMVGAAWNRRKRYRASAATWRSLTRPDPIIPGDIVGPSVEA